VERFELDGSVFVADTGAVDGDKHGVNVIIVGQAELLLTSAGGGRRTHLTAMAETDGPKQAAVPEFVFQPGPADRRPGLANYDHEALLLERWCPTTLCGRSWVVMIGGDGGSISPYGDDPEFAPSCKRCLALMDRLFPPPAIDPQLPLAARVVADVVTERGYAEIHGVPGDQQSELRRQVRSLIRRETGHPCQTLVHESTVYIVCEPIADLHRLEDQASAASAIGALLFGEEPVHQPDPQWRLFWSTWAAG
jgi:hypothetical protein